MSNLPGVWKRVVNLLSGKTNRAVGKLFSNKLGVDQSGKGVYPPS